LRYFGRTKADVPITRKPQVADSELRLGRLKKVHNPSSTRHAWTRCVEKTIARGMPGVSGVVTNARVYHYTRGCGCADTRHSLRPLSGEGGNFSAKPQALRAARANVFLNVIASLSSGARSRDPLARNDGICIRMPTSASPRTRRNPVRSIIFLVAAQNLDLNNSKFRSNIGFKVHSME
jgi:hypothetical protein